MAVVAWNMSLVPEKDRGNIENKIVEIMPEEVDALGVASMVELVDMLIQRKVKYYKDIKYFIKNYNLSFSDDGQFRDLEKNNIRILRRIFVCLQGAAMGAY